MEVRKVGDFSAEEFEALKAAGNIIGATAKALEAGDVNELGEQSEKILEALVNVLGRIGLDSKAKAEGE